MRSAVFAASGRDNPSLPRLASLVFLPVGVLGLSSCGGHHEAGEIEPLPAVAVERVTVQVHEVPVFEEVVGTVRPRQEAQVAAKVTGRVLEMNAVPGMKVKGGDVIARLEVGELEAALQRAEASLAQADRERERYRKLRETGAATEAEFEQVESRRQIAAATVEETRNLVENATVTAPFDGTVTRKLLEPGDLASPGRPLFAMEDSSLLRLEINVAESLAGGLSIGDRFRVEIADSDLEGSVSEIAPSADVGSRTFSVKLDLPENDQLRAGQFGRAFLPRGKRQALTVPDGAVVARGQMDYLFVVEEGAVHLRIVRTGASRDGETEILAGLDGGESIVPAPTAELQDGQPTKEG
ncbi:MAG: efflux RND transporter periplasmic adaptor subunit [Verrucomicrobiae bacterium]|nr:efflux RND transporter periplasmic adaptor subunit [Verrucomicrobiae bacterium]